MRVPCVIQRIGLELDEKQKAALKQAVRDAVVAVEEQARQTPMGGTMKRDLATELVMKERPNATPEEIRLQIHATLPEVREQIGTPASMKLPSLPADRPGMAKAGSTESHRP
jgi:hypothetical protein